MRVTLISRWLLVILSAFLLATMELASRLRIGNIPSLNFLVTACILAMCILLILSSRYSLKVLVIGMVTSTLLGLEIYYSSTNEISWQHMQYSVPTICFLLLLSTPYPLINTEIVRDLFFFAGLTAAAFLSFSALSGLSFLGRASEIVAPLCAACLLGYSNSRRRSIKALGWVAAVLLLIAMTVSTARSATFLVTVVIFVNLLFVENFRTPHVRVILGLSLITTELMWWLVLPFQRNRLTGLDSTWGVGPLRINGEGRSAAADVILGQGAGQNMKFEFLFGHGLGASSQILSNANFVLDKVHNEFLRVFYDLGLIPVSLFLVLLIAVTSKLFINLLKSGSDKVRIFIPFAVFLSLGFFSITDNVLSYSWFMIPAGLLASQGFTNKLPHAFSENNGFAKKQNQFGS